MHVSKFECEMAQYARKLWNGSVCFKVIPTGITDFKIDLEVSFNHNNKEDKKIKSLLLKLIDKLKDAECAVVIQRRVSD